MHLKNMHRYFFEIYTFSLSSHRISQNFRASELENLFSFNECSRKCYLRKKKLCRIFVPAS